jgi:hypothetical protein
MQGKHKDERCSLITRRHETQSRFPSVVPLIHRIFNCDTIMQHNCRVRGVTDQPRELSICAPDTVVTARPHAESHVTISKYLTFSLRENT